MLWYTSIYKEIAMRTVMVVAKYITLIIAFFIITSCSDGDSLQSTEAIKSYTVNFDGSTTYGTLDSPWTPTGADWEIEIVLLWDSSVGSNVYPLSTNSSSTSIYIDSGGLPLFKYDNSYITGNNTRLQNLTKNSFKFTVSASQVKCYINGVLENTVATTKSLNVPWLVIGAHSTYINKFKGQIRKLTLTDLNDNSNSKEINLVFDVKEITAISDTVIRNETNVDFVLDHNSSFVIANE